MQQPVDTQPGQGERGSGMVEFALIGPLFVLLIVGMINFGLLLNYKENATNAVNSAAREGVTVVAAGDPAGTAYQKLDELLRSNIDRGCASGDGDGTVCGTHVHDCSDDVSAVTVAQLQADQPADDPNDEDDCLTVRVEHDNVSDTIHVPIPLMEAIAPDSMAAQATSQIEPTP